MFSCTCYILNNREQLSKFQANSDKCVFLGYSPNNRAYIIYNLRVKTIMKSINVVVDDFNEFTSIFNEDDAIYLTDEVENQLQKKNVTPDDVTQSVQDTTTKPSIATTFVTEIFDPIIRDPLTRIEKNHLTENIIGDLNEGIKMRDKPKRNYQDMVRYVCYTSSIKLKNVKEVLLDEYWVKAMQDEWEQFVRNDIWSLVSKPKNTNVIGTKWIFKNKSDASSNIT